jgi:hypothetical protein
MSMSRNNASKIVRDMVGALKVAQRDLMALGKDTFSMTYDEVMLLNTTSLRLNEALNAMRALRDTLGLPPRMDTLSENDEANADAMYAPVDMSAPVSDAVVIPPPIEAVPDDDGIGAL